MQRLSGCCFPKQCTCFKHSRAEADDAQRFKLRNNFAGEVPCDYVYNDRPQGLGGLPKIGPGKTVHWVRNSSTRVSWLIPRSLTRVRHSGAATKHRAMSAYLPQLQGQAAGLALPTPKRFRIARLRKGCWKLKGYIVVLLLHNETRVPSPGCSGFPGVSGRCGFFACFWWFRLAGSGSREAIKKAHGS